MVKGDEIDYIPSKEAIIEEIKKFQVDTSIQWLLFGYQEMSVDSKLPKGVSNKIELLRSSNDVLDTHQLELLRDSNTVETINGVLSPFSSNYFIVRIDSNRFIFINWLGAKTKALMKTRVMAHRLELKSLAEHLLKISFVFDHNGVDEFDKLSSLVGNSRGFEFENKKDQVTSSTAPSSSNVSSLVNNTNSSVTKSSPRNQSPKNSPRSNTSGSSITARYNPQNQPVSSGEESVRTRHARSGSKPPKLGLAAIMRQVLKIDSEGISSLLKSRKFGWLLLGYDSDGLCKIEGQGEEQNQFPGALLDGLKEDDIQYIVLKWTLSNTGYGGDVEKTYFLSWVGSTINSVRRGKVNQHKQEVYDFINKIFQLGGEVTITTDEELSLDYIQNLMLGNRSVVQQPSRTEWGTPSLIPPPNVQPHATATSTVGSTHVVAIKSPRLTKTSETKTEVAPKETTVETTKPALGEKKKSDLLSKIKLGFKEGKVKGLGSPKEETASTPEGEKKHHKGGVHNFSMENMDKISKSLTSPGRKKKESIKRVTSLTQNIKLENEAEIINTLYDLKDPMNKDLLWALFSYPEKSLNSVGLVESGSSALFETISVTTQMLDEAVKYIIHKYYVERNNRIEAKFRIVIWRGKSVKAYFRAICTNHAMKLVSTITPIVTPFEGEPIFITDISQLKDLKLGVPGNGEELMPFVAVKRLEEKLAQAELRENKTASPQKPVRRVSMKKATYDSGIGSGLKIEDEETLIEKMKELQSDSNSLSWIMISYKDSKTLQLEASGSGDFNNFKPKLTDDKVFYILYKQFLEELGGAPKTILIAFVGPEVRPMAKASSTPHRIALFKYCLRLVTLSSEYQATQASDIDYDSIFGKVTGSKGANKGHSTPGFTAKSFGGKSQALTLVDENNINEQLKDLKDDKTSTNWLKFGYTEDPTQLRFEEKGTGGLQEFKNKLSDATVNYVLYKTYVEHSPKVALITWVGPGVTAGTAKARATTHQMELEQIVRRILTVASAYQALGGEDLQEELIHKKLAGSTVISAPTTVSKGTFGGRDSSLKFENEQAVKDAYKELGSKGTGGIRWLLFDYLPTDQYTVTITQKGPGGVKNFKQYMTDDKVCYVVMRLTFMEYSDVAKAIVITWVGENAPSFQKALSGGHRINLYEYTRKQISVGGEYQPDNLETLSDEDLLSKITGTKNDNVGDALEEKMSQQKFERERIVQVQPTIEVKESNQYTGEFKNIEFKGKEEIKKALEKLSDTCRREQQDRALEGSTIHFIKFKLSGKELRDVTVEEIGDSALTDDWKHKHLNPTECLLFVFGLFTSEGGYGMMTKYVFLQWIGRDVKHLIKSKASEVRQSIYNFCHKELYMSGEIQGCTDPEHVTQKLVVEKITGSNVRGSEMKLEKKDKKYEGLGKEKKSKLAVSDQDKLMHLVEDMILQDYLKELEKKDKKDEEEDDNEWRNHKRITEGKLDWILMSYKKDSIDEVEVTSYGEGDVENFKQYLKPNSVNFVIIRVFHAQGYAKDISMLTENRISLAKPYFTLIYWKGENVQVLEKALTSHHFNSFHKLMTQKFMRMKSSLQGSTYQAENYEELDMERIKKLMRLYD